jgi:hypothetical protein
MTIYNVHLYRALTRGIRRENGRSFQEVAGFLVQPLEHENEDKSNNKRG